MTPRVGRTRLLLLAALLAAPRPAPLPAQGAAGSPMAGTPVAGAPVARDRAREAARLATLTVPEGFRATVFATPPAAPYPVCLTATPEGVVFACVDPNLSLTAEKGRGRVVRLEDADGDGHADRVATFAAMDSPRGVAWDGRTLYVMHPPLLTAHRDTTGDGVADVTDTLVTGLGFGLDFRGADHTTNGIVLAIDGWLYVALGDYGVPRAVGRDGTVLTHRGGGVVRVRPDGTGLALVAEGTRNIYDLAADPFGNLFSRDNTNDGDGWEVRLHFLPPGVTMGYPTLYKHFAPEHVASLADYGGGAGTGGVWVHTPAFPAGFGNTLYTADWLLNTVFRHPLAAQGASFRAEQRPFLGIPHPADLAVDARGRMYVASLFGGEYTYADDSVGFIARLEPAGAPPRAVPPIAAATDAAVRALVGHADATVRLVAQRELLRRGHPTRHVAALGAMARDPQRSAEARVAALHTVALLGAPSSPAVLGALATDREPRVRAAAVRALADAAAPAAARETARRVTLAALRDPDPRVRLAAADAARRLELAEAAEALLALGAGSDPAVAHVATRALAVLAEAHPAVRQGALAVALHTPGAAAPSPTREVALRALQAGHDSAVVEALAGAAARAATDAPDVPLLLALARLYHREAAWQGDWWGTRPSFVGPYFAPVRWEASPHLRPLLARALREAPPAPRAALADGYVRNRVLPAGAAALVAALRDSPRDSTLLAALVGEARLPVAQLAALAPLAVPAQPVALRAGVAALLAGEPALVEGALPLASMAVRDTAIPADTRARLLVQVAALPGAAGRDAVVPLLAAVTPLPSPPGTPPGALEAAWRRYVGDRRRAQELDDFIARTEAPDPEERVLAYAVLLQVVRGGRAPAAVTDKVAPVLAAGWQRRERGGELLRAVRLLRLEASYREAIDGYQRLMHPPPTGAR